MPSRDATTHWEGGLNDGKGTVTLDSSNAGQYDVNFPRRAADEAEGVTSPEELIGAAHSACYSMQLSAFLEQAGQAPTSVDTTAEVHLGPDPAGGFHLTKIELTVRAVVPGMDADAFREAAEKAKEQCPVSKALAAVPITLDASLEG